MSLVNWGEYSVIRESTHRFYITPNFSTNAGDTIFTKILLNGIISIIPFPINSFNVMKFVFKMAAYFNIWLGLNPSFHIVKILLCSTFWWLWIKFITDKCLLLEFMSRNQNQQLISKYITFLIIPAFSFLFL